MINSIFLIFGTKIKKSFQQKNKKSIHNLQIITMCLGESHSQYYFFIKLTFAHKIDRTANNRTTEFLNCLPYERYPSSEAQNRYIISLSAL